MTGELKERVPKKSTGHNTNVAVPKNKSCGFESRNRLKDVANTNNEISTTATISDFCIGIRKRSRMGPIRMEMTRKVMKDLITRLTRPAE